MRIPYPRDPTLRRPARRDQPVLRRLILGNMLDQPPYWWTAAVARLRTANTYAVDGALAAAVAVPLSVPFVNAAPGAVTPLGAALNAGTVLPLIWRRRAPFTVVVLVVIFATLVSLHHRPGQMLQYAGLLAFYTVADARPWQRRCLLGILLITFPPASLLWKQNTPAEFMFTMLLPLTAYLLGALARTSRARTEALAEKARQLERERTADAARAAAEERARIARDMHDVLAHAVSLMVVQAEAGPVVVRDRSGPRDPDLRGDRRGRPGGDGRSCARMLGRAQGGADHRGRTPQPTVAEVPALVAQVGRANLRVELQTAW